MVKKKKGKKKGNKKERKIERELLWIIVFLAFLVVVFLVASSIFRGFNSFEHEGLTFTKERFGNIPVYHYYYYFRGNDGGLIKYNLFVRNDPRENNVPVSGDDIVFEEKNKIVFVAVNSSGLQECVDGILGVAELTNFLVGNQIDVQGGNLDFWDAGKERQKWITCENRPRNIVIAIIEGDKTEINIDGNCYEITIANCEVLEATERFAIQSVLDAKKANPDKKVTFDSDKKANFPS